MAKELKGLLCTSQVKEYLLTRPYISQANITWNKSDFFKSLEEKICQVAKHERQ